MRMIGLGNISWEATRGLVTGRNPNVREIMTKESQMEITSFIMSGIDGGTGGKAVPVAAEIHGSSHNIWKDRVTRLNVEAVSNETGHQQATLMTVPGIPCEHFPCGCCLYIRVNDPMCEGS